MTAPVELVRELLQYRDMTLGSRDWGMLTAFLAGSSLALPVLAPAAVSGIAALGLHKLWRWRRRHVIAGVALPQVTPPAHAVTLYGVPRRFRTTVSSMFDDAPVLVQHAAVKDRRGAILLRRTEAAPFLLDMEDKQPVLVTGVTRVAAFSMLSQRVAVRRGDPRLERMGVPTDLAIAGDLEVSSVEIDGPALAVTGIVEEESVAELAFHRDGGRIPVMRGRIGAPVLVAERRLIAAAL